MGDSFKILFYTKRKEKLKSGQMPIMCKKVNAQLEKAG